MKRQGWNRSKSKRLLSDEAPAINPYNSFPQAKDMDYHVNQGIDEGDPCNPIQETKSWTTVTRVVVGNNGGATCASQQRKNHFRDFKPPHPGLRDIVKRKSDTKTVVLLPSHLAFICCVANVSSERKASFRFSGIP